MANRTVLRAFKSQRITRRVKNNMIVKEFSDSETRNNAARAWKTSGRRNVHKFSTSRSGESIFCLAFPAS